jgi:phytoene dehydrogenase-like protein
MHTTVVGSGVAGLIAAIECAERGASVEVLEARSRPGGRARTTPGDFNANHGPHVVYGDGSLWAWLDARGLAEPAAKAPITGARLRFDGKVRRTPPAAVLRAIAALRRDGAPVDRSLREWLTATSGAAVADIAGALCHVFTFHHDPASLSAAFIAERARRAFTLPSTVRYVPGGWGTIVDRLVAHASNLGVGITTGTRVDALPAGPVIVATELAAARRLLGDDTVRWTGARTVLVDVGLTARRGDPFVVLDLDDGVFAERFTAPDPTLAPGGHSLVQCQVGIRDDQTLEDGVAIVEGLLDDAFAGWRDREVWRRRQLVTDASGALDLPGTTWRDRPAIERGDGVYLCGDMVAAPGLLGEVSGASAVEAARLATARTRARA